MHFGKLPVEGMDRYSWHPYFSFRRALIDSAFEVFGEEFALAFIERLSETFGDTVIHKYVVATVGADRVCIVQPGDWLLELRAAFSAGDLDVIRRFVHGDSSIKNRGGLK